jgi:hypothetical protein
MITASGCIQQTRDHLNDTAIPYRWDDGQLLTFLNHALADIFRDRPDLMIDDTGKCVTDATFETVATGSVFLNERYAAALALGCTARAFELDNSDTANLALADRFFARARAELMK